MTQPVSSRKVDGGKIKGPANVPNVVEIVMVGQLPNLKQWTNTVHGFYATTPPNLTTVATALFTSLSSAWGSNLASFMSPNTSFTAVRLRDMASHLNPVFVGTGTAVPGSSASPALPENLAAVLSENIVTRGRGMKGRMFLGGWAANADTGTGIIAPTAVVALNGFGSAIFSAIQAQALTPCVAQVARQAYTGLTGASVPARSAGHVNVQSYSVRDNIWDTQRRRVQL